MIREECAVSFWCWYLYLIEVSSKITYFHKFLRWDGDRWTEIWLVGIINYGLWHFGLVVRFSFQLLGSFDEEQTHYAYHMPFLWDPLKTLSLHTVQGLEIFVHLLLCPCKMLTPHPEITLIILLWFEASEKGNSRGSQTFTEGGAS